MGKIYEAMHRVGFTALNSEGFLDLKNRKQLGDLVRSMANLRQKSRAQVFIFCSSRPGEGVTTVVANLLAYLAHQQSETRVLALDANLQAPALDRAFRLANGPGLAEVLLGEASLDQVVQTPADSPPNLRIVGAGGASAKLTGSLDQTRLYDLLTQARAQYDYVIIDAAPVMTSSDALSAAVAADGLFWVVQSLAVQAEVALKTKALLQNNECTIVGVVLNRVLQVIPSWMYRLI